MTTKTCTGCNTPKNLDCFHADPTAALGKQSRCKACQLLYQRERWRDPKNRERIGVIAVASRKKRHAEGPIAFRLRDALYAARSRSKDEGIPFDIDLAYLLSIVTDRCPALGLPFNCGPRPAGEGPRPDAPSLDRFYPERGYVKGNVAVISFLANKMKNAGTVTQVINLALWVMKTASINSQGDIDRTKDEEDARIARLHREAQLEAGIQATFDRIKAERDSKPALRLVSNNP